MLMRKCINHGDYVASESPRCPLCLQGAPCKQCGDIHNVDVPCPYAYISTGLGEYAVADLQETASHWHGGQWSALYAFCSSGTVVPGLASEANPCARDAGNCDDCEIDEADKLRAIASLEETVLPAQE